MDQIIGQPHNENPYGINTEFAFSADPPTKLNRIEHDLVERARQCADKLALVADSKHFTYEDLFAYTAHLSSELIKRGVTRGERVTVYLDKTPEAVVACYAVWLAGGILVPAHEDLHEGQLHYIMQHSGSRLLVSSSRKLTRFGIRPPDQVQLLDYSLPASPPSAEDLSVI